MLLVLLNLSSQWLAQGVNLQVSEAIRQGFEVLNLETTLMQEELGLSQVQAEDRDVAHLEVDNILSGPRWVQLP